MYMKIFLTTAEGHTNKPEPMEEGDLLLRDIPPPLGEERPCRVGSRPYDADFATLHSVEKDNPYNKKYVFAK